MNDRSIQIQLGIGAIIASAILLFVLIPTSVSSPSNVRNIVLSPLFWPNTIAILTGLLGIAMVAHSWRRRRDMPQDSDVQDRGAAALRLLGAGAAMLVTMWAMPRIGLVWTAMALFFGFALLVHTRHPRTALAAAVLVPLVLYGFFAHVAGVAIPQGDFVRLP